MCPTGLSAAIVGLSRRTKTHVFVREQPRPCARSRTRANQRGPTSLKKYDMNNNIRNASLQADDAIQRVLQAERDAEQAVIECEQEAQQIITDARKRAQAINARSDQRITNLEMRYGHRLDREIKAIEREGAAELRLDANQSVDADSLRAAIEDLAVELCLVDE